MKKALILLVVALTVGTVQGLSDQTKKVDDMVKHTSIVSVNDSDCCGIETIKNLYYHDKILQSHYDSQNIQIYVYHELDNNNFSHNEIEVNFTRYSVRYDF